MKYYIDTEFDGFRGPLISMALVREDGISLYFVIEGAEDAATDPWVRENVLPILRDCPEPPWVLSTLHAAAAIATLLAQDREGATIIADWLDDIRHLCDLMHYAPGQMIATQSVMHFEVHRVDAWPCPLPGAVQHCAWWDAVALQAKLEGVGFAA